jgi:L-alanine-DL-glutamate epimerase-like enolase superfamily enzyme
VARTDTPVTGVSSRAYRVPTDRPEADGTLAWSATTVVVAQVTAGPTTGLGWTYSSAGCRAVIERELSEAVKGIPALDVARAHEAMVRAVRNLGRPGLAAAAISAVDTALWDLKARLLGVALSDLFGRCRDDVPLYGSGGFTTYDDATTAAQLEGWLAQGMRRVKLKIAESWGSRQERDLSRAALARRVIGPEVELFVDANGGYSAKQAVRVGRRLRDDFGVVWFEEPVSSDDLAGLRLVRGQLDLDVTAGEYGYDETYFARLIGAEAVDCVQIDVTRCGGYPSWLRSAAAAAAAGLHVSGHCAPALHAQVAPAVPNLRHVEYFHDHSRLEPMLFDGVLDPRDGCLWPEGDRPGHGLSLRADAAERWRVA